MARLPRLCIAGQAHLLIQRVLQGQAVFADAADRGAYLACLGEAAARHGVALHGYGLMASEVRLLLTPPDPEALGRMVQFIGRRFVAGFNRRHGRRGGLWEGRFRATVIEPIEYFMPCLHFVEGAAEGVAPDPAGEVVPWSSASHHSGLRADAFITEHAGFWSLGNTPFDREAAHRRALLKPLSVAHAERIAEASLHGWVLGSEAFVRGLGGQVDRRLRPLAPGRPTQVVRAKSANRSGPD